MSLEFSIKKNHLGEGEGYVAQVTGRKSIGLNQFIGKLVSSGTSLTKTDYLAAVTTMKSVIVDELKAGNTLVLDGFLTISLSIGGRFDTVDEGFDSNKHELKINARVAKPLIKKVSEDLVIKKVDSNSKIPVVKSVVDLATGSDSKFLTPGRQAYINGEKLTFDLQAADEGIFFVSEDSKKEVRVIYDDIPANKKMKIIIPDLSSLGKRVYVQVRSRLGTKALRTSLPSVILEVV